VPASGPARVPVVEGAANPRAAEAAPTLRLDRLSPEQRRELGPLVIGGSIWSENASSRFVIVNGQVVREGEAAAPGVTLERIEPKAAVLRWRELRIELPF
jgi:general secretion pathway protein B